MFVHKNLTCFDADQKTFSSDPALMAAIFNLQTLYTMIRTKL